MIRTLGQADRYSSKGSYTWTILLHGSLSISAIISLPSESRCSEAESMIGKYVLV